MIDSQTVKARLNPEELQSLAFALEIIHRLNVCNMQIEENVMRIAGGFSNADPQQLATEIVQVQQTNRGLLTLHEWAGNFKKELDDE